MMARRDDGKELLALWQEAVAGGEDPLLTPPRFLCQLL